VESRKKKNPNEAQALQLFPPTHAHILSLMRRIHMHMFTLFALQSLDANKVAFDFDFLLKENKHEHNITIIITMINAERV